MLLIAPGSRPAEIARLVARLGEDDTDTWKAAARRLEALGEAALPALRAAARGHADPDVRLRAAVTARAIHSRLYGAIRTFGPGKGWVMRVLMLPDGKRAMTSSSGTMSTSRSKKL